ncbi:MAG: hypothetical protein KDD29_01650, partial [Flavobacteriales bacterium]|nr:hypothetical protein [Flavobacteriales bacterium]
KFNHEIKIHKLDGNIRYLKHQLNLQLLRSLNAYNYSQNNIEIQVSNLIQNASILINKGLFDQAHKTIQQAKTIAKEHELILYLLDCFRKEKHISRELYQIDWIEYYTNEGSFEEKKLLIEYEKTYDIYKARNELIFINNSTNDANTIIKIENFILNINHREDSSFEILETEYITKAYLYITKKEYENAKKFQKLLISLFEKHPNQINLNQANYLSALYNLLVSSFILKDFEQVELILQKLDNYRNSSANRLVNLKLFNYINIGLAFYNLNGDFKKSCSYQPLIHKGLVYFNQSIHIYAKMSLFLHLVTAHIGIGDYEKANYWVDRAITEITTKNLLHYFLAKILQLIIIYEEKRYTYLVHLSKELSEDLVTLKNDYQSFKIIVDFFKIHKFHLLNKKQLNLVFNEFKEELETFINTKNEKSIFDVFDIITWINSHIYNQSFDYLIKLKFKDYYEPIIKKHHKNSP